MTSMQETDFIVVGAGVAGLRAAIALAEAGRVLVLAKQQFSESATQYAQGGVAVALSDEDEIGLHLHDTISAGDGLVNEDAARTLVEEGPGRIQELIEWGTQFDRSGSKLSYTREAAHSRSRVLHAQGDSTGREIGRALAAKARTFPSIEFREFDFSADLIVEDGRITGIYLIDRDGAARAVRAHAVLLATGGAGQVFRDTTNPAVATGDGVAMAYRAGATVSDMEFVQFHPTALYVPRAPRFLLSEALRGEGARLLNMKHERFMSCYDKREELAPRDVVARAIASELNNSDSVDPAVFLDLRHLPADHIRQRFPRIYTTCKQFGINITHDLVPVRPAAHYLMGGVKTDLNGRSTLRCLYAAGESACTGVHGANRLASNSLLEGLVFGARAGNAMREEEGSATQSIPPTRPLPDLTGNMPPEHMATIVRNVMARYAGVVRTSQGLTDGLQVIRTLENYMPELSSRTACEAANLREVAFLILQSAIARRESRGAHFRTDFPNHNDAEFKKHSIVVRGKPTFQ